MKLFTTIVIVLGSVMGLSQTSMAQIAGEPTPQATCPDLSGTYVCRYPNGNQKLKIQFTSQENQAAIYTINETTNLIADNIVRPYGQNRFQAKCENEWLNVRQRLFFGNGFAQLLTRWKKAGTSLVETNDGYTVINGISRPVRTTYFCEAIN